MAIRLSRVELAICHLEILRMKQRVEGSSFVVDLVGALSSDPRVDFVRELKSPTIRLPLHIRAMLLSQTVNVSDDSLAEAYNLPNHPGPVVIPPYDLPDLGESYTDADREAPETSARRRRLAAMPRTDVLASYTSPIHTLLAQPVGEEIGSVQSKNWGITLPTAGIELLADGAFALAGLDRESALRASILALLAHEYLHFRMDLALLVDDVTTSYGAAHRPARLVHDALHDDQYCELGEALAEAAALRALSRAEAEEWLPSGAADAYAERLSVGQAGYRDGHRYVEEDAFHAGVREVLEHSGVHVGLGGALLIDIDERETYLGDVPVHVAISVGSAYARKAWTWAEVAGS
jgi:hypothetical protein